MSPKRVDANQASIVADLRAIGATVEHLHEVGHGCPDILVGFREANYLFEIKTESGQLRGKQRDWHGLWHGQVAVIRSTEEALKIMGLEVSDGADGECQGAYQENDLLLVPSGCGAG